MESNGLQPYFSSQRLKRFPSIVDKLRHNPQMGLDGMQDIGGVRLVFHSIPELTKAKELLSNNQLEGLSLVHEPYDYVTNPKQSGYRSIHFVYKYTSDNEEYDGTKVELQIRTRIQHDWATAVETAELISKSALKASSGDIVWQDFFKLVSAIFAIKESQTVPRQFENYSTQDYCIHYAQFNEKYNLIDKLSALVGAVNIDATESFSQGYILLLIEYKSKTAKLRHFTLEEKRKAAELYAQIENRLDRNQGAIVLVSVADIQVLHEAYPSYFLNAKEFIDTLSDFTNQCKIKGYLH